MSISLLDYAPNSQNSRVEGFEIPGDEQPRSYTTATAVSSGDLDEVIFAAYRQIFHEQQMLKFNRQPLLESQLRSQQITVRGFIRGLAISDAFRTWNYEVNNNYRFVEICVQRLLGRPVYDDREKMAWSTVLATQGLEGLVDALIGSEEYSQQFGEHRVPYQRRRVLPQRESGDLPFERIPRYGQDYLATLQTLGYDFSANRRVDAVGQLPAEAVQKTAGAITLGLAIFFGLIAVATVLSWFGWIQL